LFFAATFVLLANFLSLQAAPLTATIQTPLPAETGYLKFGTATNPAGH